MDIELLQTYPEYSDIDSFVDFLMEEGRESFNHVDLTVLNRNLCIPVFAIRQTLEGYGLSLEKRAVVREVRTYSTNSHNRWEGNPCAGGSGSDQICGFAGRAG